MPTVLIDAEGVSASRPGRPLFTGVSLTLSEGDRIGVVGLNGCGKSTLLRILAGETEPESGTVRRGRGARIGVLSQATRLAEGTVRAAAGGTWQSDAMLQRLGMGAMMSARTDELSGGQMKRTALAGLLAGEWEAFILDEPTNHLDLDAVRFLEEWLAVYGGGLLLVTHDRHVLDRVTNKVVEIDRGRAHVHVPSGVNAGSGYAAYLAARIEREEKAAVDEQVRRNAARKELAWLRRGAPARSTKPKARVDAAREIVSRRPQQAARQGDLDLSLGSTRLGSKGIELAGVSWKWESDGPHVLHDVTHSLEPGDRLGIVGANGAGKSTLLEIIAGLLVPQSGTVARGSTVRIGHYDQLGRELDDTVRVRDAVAGDKGSPSVEDINLMRRFWFDGDAQFAEIGTLSGGERRRLQLLLTLIEQPNVLLLDEPTNDLDLDTLRALEDYLDDWPGIVVVVSHDRTFLDRTVSEVMALDGDGSARLVRGGVAGWLAERETTARTPTAAPSPQGQPAAGSAAPKGKQKSTPATRQSPSTLRRLIAQAEKKMEQLGMRRDDLTGQLSTAGADHAALARVTTELAAVQDELARTEDEWLSLSAQLETAES
ncbi:MAG: ABC-F family ATP-binding cassette domain-containing protein [Actinomycetota bacterium]